MRGRRRSAFYSEVGFRLRQMRNLNKLSQETLGERLGVSMQTYQRYETGEIHIPTEAIVKCAKCLQTPVGFFLGEEERLGSGGRMHRTGLLVAAEVMALPDDNLRKSVFHLVREINRACIDDKEDAA